MARMLSTKIVKFTPVENFCEHTIFLECHAGNEAFGKNYCSNNFKFCNILKSFITT